MKEKHFILEGTAYGTSFIEFCAAVGGGMAENMDNPSQNIDKQNHDVDNQLLDSNINITNITKTIDISEDNYDIDVDYPIYLLNGHLLYKFNTAISTKVYSNVELFLNNVRSYFPATKAKSEMYGDYVTFTALKHFITTKNDLYQFLNEAAHPDHNILMTTYDIITNEIITLQDLFIQSNMYLELLSRLSEQKLKIKYPELTYAFDNSTFRQGYAPIIENYKYWALTDDGLIIIFPEYQVAPYAAGTLDILIPYGDIKDFITYDI